MDVLDELNITMVGKYAIVDLAQQEFEMIKLTRQNNMAKMFEPAWDDAINSERNEFVCWKTETKISALTLFVRVIPQLYHGLWLFRSCFLHF